MARFKSQARQAVGIVLSHNEYGLGHESIKATIKSFKDNLHFYKSYNLNKEKNLPLIDAKLALSKDYFTISKKNIDYIILLI